MGHTALVGESTSKSIIKVTAFRKSYKKQTAVRDVSFEVSRGELYGLLGPDGAGKSSLMKAVAGVMTFDAGEVEIFDTPVDSEASAELIKDRIGFMPQGLGLNLYPDLTVEENIDFFARLRLVPEQLLFERKERLLGITRLTPFRDRPMKKLSGGMKQKLGLICTLIHEPKLLILDEPTTGVDPVSRRDFWTILSELLHEQQTTALVTTSYMDEASRFHRVSLLYDGQVLAEGDPEQVCASVPGVVVMLKTDQQAEAIDLLRRSFSQVQPEGKWIRLFVDGDEFSVARQKVRNAMGSLSIKEIRTDDTELEDAFVALLQERKLAADDSDDLPESSAFGHGPRLRLPEDAVTIEASELTKDFGNFRAVDDVSFQVRKGEIFGLLGANGAGKTTVIKMLTGILSPTAGGGAVAGADLAELGRAIKQRIGYMSQQFSLYTDLTVVENILLYAGIYGLRPAEARARCEWICEMAGLRDKAYERTSSLPVGLRQRLALGCALVHRPRVLFLDEPTSGIDPIGRQQFWKTLFRLSRDEGVTTLVTTHYMSEAEHCDHLVLMHAGKLVADASPDELKQEVADEAGQLLAIDADDPGPVIDRLSDSGFSAPVMVGRHVHVLSKTPEIDAARIPHLLDDVNTSVHLKELSMEDVFVHKIRALERSAAIASSGKSQ